MNARVRFVVPAAAAALFVLTALPAAGATQPTAALGNINHIVVIYQENHSFDNLYGTWERVNGLSHASAANTLQLNQAGAAFTCLKQNDVNLTTPPQPASCTDAANGITSNFSNQPFNIDDYIATTDTTCPAPGAFYPNGVVKGSGLPGGCTEDLVHRYADSTGRDVSMIHYYEAFAIFKVAVVVQQIYYRYHRGQTNDARFADFGRRASGLLDVAWEIAQKL